MIKLILNQKAYQFMLYLIHILGSNKNMLIYIKKVAYHKTAVVKVRFMQLQLFYANEKKN